MKFILVYQAGIANLFEVDRLVRHADSTAVRVFQGAFRTAEAMARGVMLAGAELRIASCNIAGDCSTAEWVRGTGGTPFSYETRPPRR